MSDLKAYIERIENLNEDKKVVTDDIKSVYDEAANDGFDKKILRTVIKLRAQDPEKREYEESLVETYMNALNGTRKVVAE